MTQFDHMLRCFTQKNDDEPIIKDNPQKEDNTKKVKRNGDNDDPKKEDQPKNKDGSKNAEGPKNEHSPKDWKEKNVNQKRLTFTATAQATFPLDYPSKNDLRPAMRIIVETENRNPHVKNMICGKVQKLKTTFWMQRRLM